MNEQTPPTHLVLCAIAQGKFPKTLYKYRNTSDATDKIFGSTSLWFAKPSTFNDPFDCNLSEVKEHSDADAKQFLAHILDGRSDREFLERSPASTAELVKIMKAAKARALDRTGVTCLSRTFDHVLMWSHYGQEHKGLVIEFDLEEDPDFFTTPINVVYSVDYEPTNYFADPLSSVTRIISTKSKAWDYEGEVRIMKSDVTGAVAFRPSAMKRVIFGCRADEAFIERIVSLCSKEELRHVEFARMTRAHARFALTCGGMF